MSFINSNLDLVIRIVLVTKYIIRIISHAFLLIEKNYQDRHQHFLKI